MSQFIEMTTRSELNKKSIGEIAEVRTGSTPSRRNPEYWNGTHYWVSAQDMGNKYIYDTLEKITDKGYATCKVVPAGSILYVCRGSIGVMSINTMDCATNQSICTATCKTGYNTEYLYYALKVAEKAIKKQGIGTSFKSLNQSAFASIEILFPAIEIQDKFATIAKQADKSKFGDFKSQFIEMFGDCANRIKLSSLCSTFVDGDWIESKDQSEFGIRLIQTGNVGNGFFKDKEDKSRYISEETFDNLHCTEIYPGDILVSRLPDPIGRACIIPQGLGRTITAVDCTIIRLKDIILPDYFIAYTMTPSYVAQINEVTTGTTRRRVSRANLGNILVPCPSIAKQKQFFVIAKQADKSKSYVWIALKNLESMLGYYIRQVA
jgi:type I restriction enzyme S subunit